MINNKSVLVTICARGGSKGIPGKNIKPLGGKPLIEWTLDLLPQLKYVDNHVISTDSDSILDYCVSQHEQFYAYKRPAELATDTVSRVEAVKHAVKKTEVWFCEHYDIIVDLGVATPFKTAADVNEAIELLLSSKIYPRLPRRVISGTNASHNPYFSIVETTFPAPCVRISKDAGYAPQCRQDAPRCYDLNDAINVWWRDSLFAPLGEYADKWETVLFYEMPPERSIHLDSHLDWLLAEAVIEHKLI